MPSGGVALIKGFVRAACFAVFALVVPACGPSSPPPGGGGCADRAPCGAVGAVCAYGYSSCTCNKDGTWHCDTPNCPGKAPHPGADCPAALYGMVCNYPGVSCQCVAAPGGYAWAC